MTRPEVLTGPSVSYSSQPPSLRDCTKKQLLEYFENTYSLDEWVFTSIKDEKYFYKCPDRLRLPLIFYYCHPAVVYVNKLLLAGLLKKRVNPEFEAMFETGVDEMSWDDTENYRMGGAYKWPPLKDVVEYRRKVRQKIRDIILHNDVEFPVTQDSPWWAMWMGLEHERIHLETSSVLIRQLPTDMVEKPVDWKYGPLTTETPVLENPLLPQSASTVRLGKDADCPIWGWDNEYGSLKLDVPAFEASKFMVTNREMVEFIQDGGYEERQYWSDEGWEWVQYKQAKHPPFWVCNRGCKSNCGADLSQYSHCANPTDDGSNVNGRCRKYLLRLMFDVVSLPLDWPAEVTYHEAKAFCAWKGPDFRLPTEAENHMLRGLQDFDANKIETDPVCGENVTAVYNVDFAYGSSTPVNLYPPSPSGCCDTFGNAWEWVEDHFNGLPGFAASMYYEDFSAPCFDGKHTMILGGSWISTGNLASRFARYAFRRHFIQHAGFRMARSTNNDTPVKVVETPVYVLGCPSPSRVQNGVPAKYGVKAIIQPSTNCQYVEDTNMWFRQIVKQQYSTNGASKMEAIFKRIRSLAWEATTPQHASSILVIGCGPGKLAFDLTKFSSEVIACDASARCINFALKLKSNGKYCFTNDDKFENGDELIENGHESYVEPPQGAVLENVDFKQLTWIPCELRNFDLIINMYLDRAENPLAWIIRMKEMVRQTPTGKCIFISRDWSYEKLKDTLEPDLSLVKSEKVQSNSKMQMWLSVWESGDA
uniref:Uncharacterized protein LOC100176451 n=1 Tax=Phallusia mammillata TaxID=59560 RepID=A0A6F9DH78_9ASCI|nr:uncharacterized protein LOC100176451 [Phallusia mammillata]